MLPSRALLHVCRLAMAMCLFGLLIINKLQYCDYALHAPASFIIENACFNILSELQQIFPCDEGGGLSVKWPQADQKGNINKKTKASTPKLLANQN